MSLTGLAAGEIPLFLSDKELRVLSEIAKRKDMSHPNVMRMALR